MHHDVSSGNIIIKPTDNGSGTVGRLIDFDHAKVTEKFAPMKCLDVTDTSTVELHRAVISRDLERKPDDIDEKVVIKAFQVVPSKKVFEYVGDVLKVRQQFFNFSMRGKLTPGDLHWDMVVSITCNTM